MEKFKTIDGNTFYLDTSSLLENTWWRPVERQGRDGKNHISKEYVILPKNRLCAKLCAVRDWIENVMYEHPLRFFGTLLLIALVGTAICGYGSYQIIAEDWDRDFIFWIIHVLTACYFICSVIYFLLFGNAVQETIEERRYERALQEESK